MLLRCFFIFAWAGLALAMASAQEVARPGAGPGLSLERPAQVSSEGLGFREEFKPAQPRMLDPSKLDTLAAMAEVTDPGQIDLLKALAHRTMLDFAEAVKEGSFANFYQTVSQAWQRQVTAGALEAAFAGFVSKKVNLAGLRELVPVFDAAPALDGHHLLQVAGHYPTHPYEVVFSLKYLREGTVWKLFGIDVNLRKAD
jgi:hypothetical protein